MVVMVQFFAQRSQFAMRCRLLGGKLELSGEPSEVYIQEMSRTIRGPVARLLNGCKEWDIVNSFLG